MVDAPRQRVASVPRTTVVLTVHVFSALLPPLFPLALALANQLPASSRVRPFVRAGVAIDVLTLLLLLAAVFLGVADSSRWDRPGYEERASIGVQLDPTSVGEGVAVASVGLGSPADEAGIMPGDRILAIANVQTRSVEALQAEVSRHAPHEALSLTVRVASSDAVEEREVIPASTTAISRRSVAFMQRLAWFLAGVAVVAIGWLSWRAHRRRVAVLSFLAPGALALIVPRLTMLGADVQKGMPTWKLVLRELLFVLGAAYVWRRWDRGEHDWQPRSSGPRSLGAGAVLTVAWLVRGAMLLQMVSVCTGLYMGPGDALVQLVARPAGSERWLVVAAVAVLAPVAEELFFRGGLLPWLRTFLDPWPAIVFAGCLFGAAHASTHGAQAFMIVPFGCILGWVRVSSGSVWWSVLLHAALNGTMCAVLFAR